MLIRTQSKRSLIELKELKIEIIMDYDTDKYIIKALLDKYPKCLGEYSTEEKAIKVLDMIEEKYLDANYYNYGCYIKNMLFKMPQDEEVNV